MVEFINSHLSVLKQHNLEGIKLLGVAPDNVAAGILSIGEDLGDAFSAMLSAKGIANRVIDPVKYVLAEGDYLDSIADVSLSKARFSDVPTDGSEFLVMPGFVAANEAGEKVSFGVTALTIQRPF